MLSIVVEVVVVVVGRGVVGVQRGGGLAPKVYPGRREVIQGRVEGVLLIIVIWIRILVWRAKIYPPCISLYFHEWWCGGGSCVGGTCSGCRMLWAIAGIVVCGVLGLVSIHCLILSDLILTR